MCPEKLRQEMSSLVEKLKVRIMVENQQKDFIESIAQLHMTQEEKDEINKEKIKFRSNAIIQQFKCAINNEHDHVKCESHEERKNRILSEFVNSDK